MSPEDVARRINETIAACDGWTTGDVITIITTSLREYGEAVKKEQLTKLFPVNADDFRDATLDKLLKEADAEGFRRGMSYRETYFAEEMKKEYRLGESEGYRRGVEEAFQVVIDYKSNGHYETGHGFMIDLNDIGGRIKQLLRGTGGGE